MAFQEPDELPGLASQPLGEKMGVNLGEKGLLEAVQSLH